MAGQEAGVRRNTIVKALSSVLSEETTIPSATLARAELYALMAGEHARLDELLAKAAGDGSGVDGDAYQRFRERLLRHIRIEERMLFPLAERKRGKALSIAGRLRLDHGALAALMMLPPARHAFRAIRAVLDAHNPLEETEGGIYDQCENLARSEISELMAQIAAAPRVPVSSWVDSPKVLAAAQRVLVRAGYDPALLEPDDRDCR